MRIRFQERDRESLTDISSFLIPAGTNGAIPLSALISPKVLNTPKSIRRSDKRITQALTVELRKEGAKETRDQLMALQQQISLPKGVSFNQTRVRTKNEEIASYRSLNSPPERTSLGKVEEDALWYFVAIRIAGGAAVGERDCV